MKYRTIKGVQDILPPDVFLWQKVEAVARKIFSLYGYNEIRFPVIEFTGLFVRSIGETTDIVEKEMYTFEDRAGRSLTLRPEGTASAVRAYVQNHLHTRPAPQKFYYIGPMFRYERPQKGRFRQFHQIGVEAFGLDAPAIDAEVIDLLRTLLEGLGLSGLMFEVNSIGCEVCRPPYREKLVDFLSKEISSLCSDCRRRYLVNPLRVLDCKVPGCIEVRKRAPVITDNLCNACRGHFDAFLEHLGILGIPYCINPEMVRGLDYYTRTTFEVTSEHLGAQNSVAAGGRYDGLVKEFGGPETPAVGFALGMERLIALLKEKEDLKSPGPYVYFATIGEDAYKSAFRISGELRRQGIRVEMDYSGASLKSQMRKADKLNSRYVFILGEDELLRGVIKYKRLQDGAEGETAIDRINQFFAP